MGLTDKQILETIAYFEYERLKRIMGKDFTNDPLRDWKKAERIFFHFTSLSDWRNPFWRADDYDYSKKYGYLFKDRLANGTRI